MIARRENVVPSIACAAALLVLGGGCGRQPAPPATAGPAMSSRPAAAVAPAAAGPLFLEDATARSGLRFQHDSGARGAYVMPEQVGSGAAVFDADGDGRMDLYLVQNGGPDATARNTLFLQSAAGTFTDASAGSGLDVAGFGMGAFAGDVDNDGRPDVVVTEFGAARFFHNETASGGPPRFREQTRESGLDNPRWATAAAFVDYDRDGWLDLVVANYIDYSPTHRCFDPTGAPEYCGPDNFQGTVTRLFHNRGAGAGNSGPRFEDVSVPSGFTRATGPALGVLCADFDGDRWPDIFIADDGKPNRLFMNRRDGTFAEEAVVRGVAYNAMGNTAGNMGIAVGDVDGNGLFDLFVTHLVHEQHAFWVQDRRGLFLDRIAPLGLANPAWRGTGFGAVLVDFDCDGALDLAWANGAVRRGQVTGPRLEGLSPTWSPYAQRSQIFRGAGDGRFTDISPSNPAFSEPAAVGRSLAMLDYDNDGAMDLLQTCAGGPARLFRNASGARGHWLGVRAIEPSLGGRDAIGAEVIVETEGRRHWRLAQPATSYLASHDPRVHFGLGTAAAFGSIRVLWPDGSEEVFAGGAADRHLTLRHGEGRKP